MKTNESDNELKQSKKFPWSAFWMYVVIVVGTGAYISFLGRQEVLENAESFEFLPFIFTIVVLLIVSFFTLAIHFVFTYFPTKWLSRGKDVQKYIVWKAFFYSYSVMLLIDVIAMQTAIEQELWYVILSTVLTTILFLVFYYNEGEKPAQVKRAILIVSVVLTILNVGLNFAGNRMLENFDLEDELIELEEGN